LGHRRRQPVVRSSRSDPLAGPEHGHRQLFSGSVRAPQRAHDLTVPDNLTLLRRPPHSLELNGIENLWHYLRSHCWSNRTYRDYDELIEVAEESWCQYCLDTELIKSVCANNYIPTRS